MMITEAGIKYPDGVEDDFNSSYTVIVIEVVFLDVA